MKPIDLLLERIDKKEIKVFTLTPWMKFQVLDQKGKKN